MKGGFLGGKAKNRCDDVGAASGGNAFWRKPMIRGGTSPGGNLEPDLKVAVGAKPERVNLAFAQVANHVKVAPYRSTGRLEGKRHQQISVMLAV